MAYANNRTPVALNMESRKASVQNNIHWHRFQWHSLWSAIILPPAIDVQYVLPSNDDTQSSHSHVF